MYRGPTETQPLLGDRGRDDPLAVLTNEVTRLVTELGQFDKNIKQLGTQRDTSRLRSIIQEQRQSIPALIRNTSDYIKRIQETSVDKVKFKKLLTTFQDHVKKYQVLAEDCTKKERMHAPVQETFEPTFQPQEDQEDFLLAQLKPVDSTEHDRRIIQERNQGIQQITDDLETLHEIFSDLGVMIHQQGEEIKTVEQDVHQTDVRVSEAVGALREASYIQKDTRRRKVCIGITVVIIFLIIAAIVGLIIYLKFGS